MSKLTREFGWLCFAAVGALLNAFFVSDYHALKQGGHVLPPLWMMWASFVFYIFLLGAGTERIYRLLRDEKQKGNPRNPLPDPKWDNLPSAPYFNKARLR